MTDERFIRLFWAAVFLVTVLVIATAAAVQSEETPWYPLGEAGLALADLSPQLLLDGDAVADPGMSLVNCNADPECVNGTDRDYRIVGLPDLSAGDSGTYSLTFAHNGAGYTYYWPSRTQTPVSTVNRVSYQVTQNPLELFTGATQPSASLTISGLSADPTGSTVTFSMWTQSGTLALDGVSASVDGVEALSDGTYELTVTHDWLVAETADSGSYYARFTVTLPGGGIMIAPPAPNRLGVRIYAP